MTEWNAGAYARESGLQWAMAEEVLALLHVSGQERVLDVGCGDGKITAVIAERVPGGSVAGIDPSRDMIAFAARKFDPVSHPNLRFEVGDARRIPFSREFDLAVSFNALHWVREQAQALSSIHSVLKPGGTAQLRLVSKGERKSLEHVIEETRMSPNWSQYFAGYHAPYLHLTPEQYRALAEDAGFRVTSLQANDKAWNFQSREGFVGFATATFVEWTRRLPDGEKQAFIADVLDRYRLVAAEHPGEENTFKFYQMDVTLLA